MFIAKVKASSVFRQQKFKISELKFLAKEVVAKEIGDNPVKFHINKV